jgi:lysophospholipase L1-like esterase
MPKIEFVNHGVPGAPSGYIAERWLGTELDPSLRELVVFCLGTNDAVLGIDLDDSIMALEHALDHAELNGVPAFVVGPPPIGDGSERDAALADLSSTFDTLLAMRAVPYLPTFEALGPGSVWRAEALAADGTHPGAGGYAELAELLRTGGLTAWLLAMSAR